MKGSSGDDGKDGRMEGSSGDDGKDRRMEGSSGDDRKDGRMEGSSGDDGKLESTLHEWLTWRGKLNTGLAVLPSTQPAA